MCQNEKRSPPFILSITSSINSQDGMSCSRRIQFDGDDAAYIRFLEERVFELEATFHRPPQQRACIATPQSSRGQGDLTSNQRENFEIDGQNATCSGTSEMRNSLGGVQPRLDSSESQGDKQHSQNPDEADSQCTGLRIIEYNPQNNNKSLKQKTGESARAQLENLNRQTTQQVSHSLDGTDDQRSRSQSEVQRFRVQSEFGTFLDNLPLDLWKDWVSPVDEVQRRDILRGLVQDYAFHASTHGSSGKAPEASYTSSRPVDMIPILHQYGIFTMRSSGLDRKLACFRELVFVSMCGVALRISGDRDRVYEVMRTFRGSDTGSKHLGKLICGAKWANRAISLLSQTKWASRSWEVIFAGKSTTYSPFMC